MCDEIISYVRRFARGFTINRDKMALDVIASVGPGGNYLAEMHTAQQLPGGVLAAQADQPGKPGDLGGAGGHALRRAGHRAACAILATRQPEPLSAEVVDRLDTIVQRADDALLKFQFVA